MGPKAPQAVPLLQTLALLPAEAVIIQVLSRLRERLRLDFDLRMPYAAELCGVVQLRALPRELSWPLQTAGRASSRPRRESPRRIG
jgi:hypothetical protein